MPRKYTVTQKVIDNARRAGTFGGRPRGSKTEETLQREAVAKEMRLMFMKAAKPLALSQMALAKGLTFLYKIKTYKGGKRSKPMIVKDEDEILAYLAGEKENSTTEYFFMATERPNNQALESIFDRAFGKAIATVEITGKDGQDLFRPNDEEQALADAALAELDD